MLVLVAWGGWKTALWFGLRRRHIAIDALANTLALDSLLVFRGTSPMPNRAFNTTIHIFEWIGSVDCAWGPELRADPPIRWMTRKMDAAELALDCKAALGLATPVNLTAEYTTTTINAGVALDSSHWDRRLDGVWFVSGRNITIAGALF